MSETPDASVAVDRMTLFQILQLTSGCLRPALETLAPLRARVAMDPKARRAPRPRLREIVAGLCLALAAVPSCGFSGVYGLLGLAGRSRSGGAPAALRAVAVEESVKRSPPWKPPRPPLVPMLFETFNVSDNTDVKAIAGYISGVLEESEALRIVDMKVMTRKARSKALYILAYINAKEVRTTAQILPRQRDGRCRLRVIRDFPVTEDPDPAILRVGSNTNATALANLIAYRLRSVETMGGDSRANTVKLELLGTAASSVALVAVEKAHCMTSREMAVVARFAKSDEGEDERPIISATVTAT
ncbi:unnamed protein product [Symbiodinium sp. CCMP2456]|nr:unnamed protein product [Symbiodinium sp. CCMP2456]